MGRVNSFFFSFLATSVVSTFAAPLIDGEFSAGFIKQKPSGWVNYKGDQVDIKNDLKIGDENSYFVKAKIEHPIPVIPNLYLQYTKMKFSGDGKVKNGYTFGNITVYEEDRVLTDLKLNRFDIGLFYNLPFVNTLSLGKVKAEAGLFVRVIDFKARVEDKTRNETDETSATVPVPLLYLSVGFYPVDFVSINVEGKGVVYSGNHYYDIQGEVRVYPLSFGIAKPFLSAGYRYEKLKLDDIDDTSADIKVKQPFVSAGLLF